VPPGLQNPSLLEGPLIDPNGPVASVLGRLALPGPAAIIASHEAWPDRLEGSQNVTSYLEWLEKVRPGGSLHRSNGLDPQADLRIRGKSIEDISQVLILAMDQFHCARAGLEPDPGASSQAPEGAEWDQFESLGPFFNLVRYYGMYVCILSCSFPC
jgi:hypothetical protein